MFMIRIMSNTHFLPPPLWQAFVSTLQEELASLEPSGYHYELQTWQPHDLLLTCPVFPQHVTAAEVTETFRIYVGSAVADFIVNVLEPEWMLRTLRKDYPYLSEEEIEKTLAFCQQMLSPEDDPIQSEGDVSLGPEERKRQIFKKAYAFLSEGKVFHVDGFIHFRLKNYRQDLLAIIDFAVDEYILDQEYQEFIRLLRHFIAVQPMKTPLVHILHIQDHQFQLLDEEGQYIPAAEIEKHLHAWTKQSVHPEELIISTLVTLAPEKIIVHTNHPADTVIDTLQSIFEDRMNICTGCTQCCNWNKA